MTIIKNILIKIKELTKNILTLRAQLRLMETRLNNIDSKAQTPNYDISSPILTKTLDANNIWMGEKGVSSYANMGKLDVYYDEDDDKWKVSGIIDVKYIYVHVHGSGGNEYGSIHPFPTRVIYYFEVKYSESTDFTALYHIGYEPLYGYSVHPRVFVFPKLPIAIRVYVGYVTDPGASVQYFSSELAITTNNQILTFIFP